MGDSPSSIDYCCPSVPQGEPVQALMPNTEGGKREKKTEVKLLPKAITIPIVNCKRKAVSSVESPSLPLVFPW